MILEWVRKTFGGFRVFLGFICISCLVGLLITSVLIFIIADKTMPLTILTFCGSTFGINGIMTLWAETKRRSGEQTP